MTNSSPQPFPLFESIRLVNGMFEHIDLHKRRIQSSQKAIFGRSIDFDLEKLLRQHNPPPNGLLKCRLQYGTTFSVPEFTTYVRKSIKSLQAVECYAINYSHKFNDRTSIELVYAQRNSHDDVLIVKNGLITDTSYCNIVFRSNEGWFTPENPLLHGVQRDFLLQEGTIKRAQIRLADIQQFTHFRLINAMIPWEEAEALSIGSIFLPIK